MKFQITVLETDESRRIHHVCIQLCILCTDYAARADFSLYGHDLIPVDIRKSAWPKRRKVLFGYAVIRTGAASVYSKVYMAERFLFYTRIYYTGNLYKRHLILASHIVQPVMPFIRFWARFNRYLYILYAIPCHVQRPYPNSMASPPQGASRRLL